MPTIKRRNPLALAILVTAIVAVCLTTRSDVHAQIGDEPIVYVVAAVDTEADNNHPTGSYHTVFEVYNYQRPTDECPSYQTEYSEFGSTWTAYEDGSVFNFQVKPTGAEEAVEGFKCGTSDAYGLDDYHRAVRFTVPETGDYDIEVQIAYVGSPPDTDIHVVPDDGGDPDTTSYLATYTLSTGNFSSGAYVTIAENLTLTAGQPYWWYAERQSSGDDDNQFAVYRGVAGGETTVSRIMDEDFRNSHVDSFGDPFKMSWFMEMDNFINQGEYADGTPFDYLTLYNEMMDNWGSEVEGWGDEIAYHHHFMHWNGSSWVRTTDLTGYDWHNEALDYMILDSGFFPVTFRSGWLWSSNESQAWIEDWMPIDYSNLPGNEYWPDAPDSWFPYHPSTSDYQTPGEMDHWIARCDSGPSQDGIDDAFEEAQTTQEPVVYCWYTHKRSPMSSQLDSVQAYLENAESNYDGVSFRYATAQETLQQAVLDCADTTPPGLTLLESDGMHKITSDEPLWGAHPYATARYVGDGREVYTHTTASEYDTNEWEVNWPADLTTTIQPTPYEVASVTAESAHPDHPAAHAVDGNTSTYWDSTGETAEEGEVPVWIRVDLEEVREVRRFTIHFWDGAERYYEYRVEASTDGDTWTEIVSESTVYGEETHDFDPAESLRYARVTVTENSGPNNYAHVREIALYGQTEPESEVLYLQEVGAGGIDLCGNSAAASREIGANLVIDKSASGDAVRVGDTLTYTVAITNNSVWGLTEAVVTDSLPSNVTLLNATASQGTGCSGTDPVVCNLGELASNESALVTVVVNPTAAGTLTNEAVVAAVEPWGDTVMETATNSVHAITPSVDLTKTADPAVVNVGDDISYTFTVDNTGDSDLSAVEVTDDLLDCTPNLSSGDDGDDILQPDETWTYTCSVTAGSEDVENTASVTATDEAGGTVSDDSGTVLVDVIHPGIELTKTADPAVVNVGDPVAFTLTVDNTGDSDLSDVEVTDDLPGCTLSAPSGDDGDDVLQPDETWTYTCSVTAGSGDLENTGSVTATDEAGGTVSDDSDPVFVDVINPYVGFRKDVSPTVAHVGDTVNFTITVENTGDSVLSNVVVEDDLPGCTLEGPEGDDGDEILGLTETWVYTCSVAAGDEDIVNTATLTATDEAENTVTDSTQAEPVDVIHPDIEITKTADPALLSSGSNVTFTITVTNAGDVTLTGIEVTDPLVENCDASFDSLDAGASTSYTCQDLAVTESYTNTATVEGTDVLSRVVSDTDSAAVEVGEAPEPEPAEHRIYLPIVTNDRAEVAAESRRTSRSRTTR
jgi:uncharacterized repeat protein (TIGR01451 family)